MKIAIIGTRGIPNNYGGFEQLAQYLSAGLCKRGHELYVYSSHLHPYKEQNWEGIHIIHKYDPENKIGTAGQFIYDFNCILDSRKRGFDIIINLGYTSSSLWMRLFPKKSVVVTNMDGLEWKRSKYSKPVQNYLLLAEKMAVKGSDFLVADSLAIKNYLKIKYNSESTFIAYGADVFRTPQKEALQEFNVTPFNYSMLIARMEPENNIEMILDGVTKSKSEQTFFVIGNTQNKFGTFLREKFKTVNKIKFLGPIYDAAVINNLRHFTHLYFHGHSVGGTNPSLLEAMGCYSLIASHNNEFNRSVLGNEAFYFNSAAEVSSLLDDKPMVNARRNDFITANIDKIEKDYSWSHITDLYENLMKHAKS